MSSKSKRSDDLTPSLFDEPAAVAAQADDSADELDDWHEVPQARFLSWSHKMQLHYCWRRDMDAALRVEMPSMAEFFLTRAALYKSDLDAL